MINLDKIQSMWQEDCKIDIDNMHEESIKVPQLHSKYHEILNNLILLRTKAQKIQKSVRHERYEYYSGKADPEVYEKEPFPKKVRDKDALIRYMDADNRVSDANLKVEYYDVMINYTESILKQISNRTYQIKNSIEWHKFQAGFT
jgi:hypothetical protein